MCVHDSSVMFSVMFYAHSTQHTTHERGISALQILKYMTHRIDHYYMVTSQINELLKHEIKTNEFSLPTNSIPIEFN